MDLGVKVEKNKEYIQIGERICINLNIYLLPKEILTRMELVHELGHSQHWVIIGVDGTPYCIATWHI